MNIKPQEEMTQEELDNETTLEYQFRKVLTGGQNWIHKESPISSYSDENLNIKLPQLSAYMEFAGDYFGLTAFPLLRLFQEQNIDALIEAEYSELTPEALKEWEQFKKEEPNSAWIMDSDHYWNDIAKEIFVNEEDFNNSAIFRKGMKLYGENHYKHQPGYVAFHLYADPKKLQDTYGNIGLSLWSVEKLEEREKEGEAFRKALFSGDTDTLGSLFAKGINSALESKGDESVSQEQTDEISAKLAAVLLACTETNKPKTKN